MEPISHGYPSLAGRFFTTEPHGESQNGAINVIDLSKNEYEEPFMVLLLLLLLLSRFSRVRLCVTP